MLPSSQEQNPTLPNYSTTNTIQHDKYPNQDDNLTTRHANLADNTSVKNDTDIPIKVYSKTNYPFPPPSLILQSKFTLKQIILFLRHLSKTDIVLLSKLIYNTSLATLTFLNYSSRLISNFKFTTHLIQR